MVDLKKMEKAFRVSVDNPVQQDIVTYLDALFNKSLDELLQKGNSELTTENRNLQVGELRILKKVIEVLRPYDGFNYSVTPV